MSLEERWSDPDLPSCPTTPSSVYTDADSDESLLSALEEGDFETALRLLPKETGTNRFRIGPDQLTPVHYACQHCRLDTIEALITQYNYSLLELDDTVPTPLQIAAAGGHLFVVKYLIEQGCSTDFKGGLINPVHLAADNGHIEIVKLFVERTKSHASLPDHDGNTPLHHASAHGQLNIVRYLSNDAKHSLSVRNKKGESLLHLAAKHCQFGVVKFLVEEMGCDPSIKDVKIGSTPLHLAAKSGCLEIVQFLLANSNCDVEGKTSALHSRDGRSKSIVSGRTPLHYASYGGHKNVVIYLCREQMCNPRCSDDVGLSPLHLACQEGHTEVVRFFLDLELIEPNLLVTEDGKTPLHSACLGGNLEIVKLLVDLSDCETNVIDTEGRTPLHYAARNGHIDIVQYLIEGKSCNPSCLDQANVTPLHLAAQFGHIDTLQYLVISAQCSTTCTEENGYTALHLAANKGHCDIVEYLVNGKYINCTIRDKVGRSPLHHASQSGYLKVVKFLSNQPECDPSCQEKGLKATPLHLASSFGHMDIVRFLIDEKGCNPTCTDKFNSTPVHRAAANGHTEIMKYLVKEKQCNSFLKNKFGNTPLHLACQKGQAEIVRLLLSISKDNMLSRNQVGRMPLDLTDNLEIISEFLKCGMDPSKGSISSRFPYLKHWDALHPTVKIFILGDLGAGKSTLTKALQGGGFFPEWVSGRFQKGVTADNETAGIIPTLFESKYFGKVIVYDFAGNHSYHAGHTAIISIAAQSSPSIFLILVDLRKSPDLIEKTLAYWTALIKGSITEHGIEPHIILIGSHEDEISKEGLRHKPTQLDKSTSTVVGYVGLVTLDCRKITSASMNKLRLLLSQKCEVIRSQFKSHHESCLLRSFLLHKFQGAIVIEFYELQEYVSHADIPDIKEKDCLYQACEMLHSKGYILFLKDSKDIGNSWLILNQEALLSMIHSFQKLIEFSNPLGLVPISQLEKTLGSIGFNITLVIRYLLRMNFCMKIADRRVLYSISGFEPPHPPEDYLFFPHLIERSTPQDVWKAASKCGLQFGWCLECVDAQDILGPRFLQVLMLRLATVFPFNSNVNSPFSLRKISCNLWKSGMSWKDARGIEVVVETVQQTRAVVVLGHIVDGGITELDYIRFRSLLLKEVRSIKNEICPRIPSFESFLHPDSLLNESLLSVLSECELQPIYTFSMEQVAKAITAPESLKINADGVFCNSNVQQDLIPTNGLTVETVLTFDSYHTLPVEILQNCFARDEVPLTMSEGTLQSIASSFDQRGASYNKILNVPGQMKNDSLLTYKELRHCLDQYSVLYGIQPHISY